MEKGVYILKGDRSKELLTTLKEVTDSHKMASTGKIPQYDASDGEPDNWDILDKFQLSANLANAFNHKFYKDTESLKQELKGCCDAYKTVVVLEGLLNAVKQK